MKKNAQEKVKSRKEASVAEEAKGEEEEEEEEEEGRCLMYNK